MFGALKLWGLRRKLRGSLEADPFQVGWNAWLGAATSPLHLRTSCSHPGWLVHCAYWSGQSQDRILEAALVMAQLAIEHGPPNVLARETVMDVRQLPFPAIAELITAIEKRFPALIGIERALPGVSSVSMHVLDEARAVAKARRNLDELGEAGARAKRRQLRAAHGEDGDDPPDDDTDGDLVDLLVDASYEPDQFDPERLLKAGKAGAAAAGFSLALQTLFHRQYGMREPLTLSAAGAAAMFHLAMPDHHTDLLALARDRFGWQHAMSSMTFTK